jgi:EAL domain-containing protein (putative c-di-GMP-specific phosphodiesterase class I)
LPAALTCAQAFPQQFQGDEKTASLAGSDSLAFQQLRDRLLPMQQRDWLTVFGVAALSCSAMIFAAMVLLSETLSYWPLAAGLLLVGAVQIAQTVLGQARLQTLSEDLAEMARERRAVEQEYYVNFVQSEAFNAEVGALKTRAAKLENDFQQAASEREAQFRDLEQRLQMAAANAAPRPLSDFATSIPTSGFYDSRPMNFESQPSAYTPPPPLFGQRPDPSMQGRRPFEGLANIFGKEGIKPEPKVPRDHLTFLLEPVIDLATNETEHYRARYNMATTTGSEIGFDRLVANADKSGLRPSLDMHVVNQALPLLKKLRIKHPNLRLFVPIGVSTLTSEPTLRKILDLVDEIGEAATGLVFELDHEDLGRLSENGVTGLAMLARRGIAMALVNVMVAGLDMGSLRHLGVKFIGIGASSVESGYGVSPSWQEFVQVARGLQFQVMLLDVATSQQAASASQVARFAAGSFFAPPRRVKGTAINTDTGSFSAAA